MEGLAAASITSRVPTGMESHQSFVDTVVARLAHTDLSVPKSVVTSTADETSEGRSSKQQDYLKELLQRNPAVFLERHGQLLSEAERQEVFSPCRNDYEVKHYLDQLNPEGAATRTKNRRVAEMYRLLKDQDTEGSFFSETAMRKRAPLLYQQYTENLSSQAASAVAAPDKLSEILLAKHDEELTRQRLAQQQHAENLVEDEESESNSEGSEGAADRHGSNRTQGDGAHQHAATKSRSLNSQTVQSSRQDRLDELREVMKIRFLAGQDADVTDYQKIDGNAALDDDWSKEARQDAEDKYFDDD